MSGRAARGQRAIARGAFMLLAHLMAACPEHASTDTPAALSPCKEVGQRCEYAPGKLGTCVVRDDCQGDDCFVCQSQH